MTRNRKQSDRIQETGEPPGNRPAESSKSQGKPGSEVVRIDADLAEKLAVIAAIERKTVSEIISPLIREEVERLYAEAIEKAQAKIKKDRN